MRKRDLTNQNFGYLQVISKAGKNRQGNYMWECLCDCGKVVIVSSTSLVSGNTKSCGCHAHDKPHHVTHGLSSKRLYNIYRCMKKRCYDKSHRSYQNYGGRGITICDEWLVDIHAFYNWALLHGYHDSLTVDRMDVNGNGYAYGHGARGMVGEGN